MSVRVNLLPDDVGRQSRASAQRAGLAVAFGLLVLLLAGGWWFNEGRVEDAQVELTAAEAEVVALQAELAELQPFADLERRRSEAAELVQAALGTRVSVAGVLQDLSSVFPPNAQLDTLEVTMTPPVTPLAGGERLVVGTVRGTGEMLLGIAPGVERLLIDLGRAAAFDNVFVTSATVDDDGTGTFSFDLELGPELALDTVAPAPAAPEVPAASSEVDQ